MRHKGKFIFINIVALVFFSVIVIILPVWRVYGGNNPLFLETSYPRNKEKNVDVNLKEIKLIFSKNVVNMSVKDNNVKCFSMYDENNKDIPLEIIMADDQIEREKRHEIILVPKETLEKSTTYTIKIASSLEAKNGVSLGENVEILFTTVGDKALSNSMGLYVVGIGLILLILYRRTKK